MSAANNRNQPQPANAANPPQGRVPLPQGRPVPPQGRVVPPQGNVVPPQGLHLPPGRYPAPGRLPARNFALPHQRAQLPPQPVQQLGRVPIAPYQAPAVANIYPRAANNDNNDDDDDDADDGDNSHPLKIRIGAPTVIMGNNNICSIDTAAITTSVSASIASAIARMNGGGNAGVGIPMIDGNGNPRKIEVVIDVGTRIEGEGNLVGDENVIAGVHGARDQIHEEDEDDMDELDDHGRWQEEEDRIARQMEEDELLAQEMEDEENAYMPAGMGRPRSDPDAFPVARPRKKQTARRARAPVVKREPLEEMAFLNDAPPAPAVAVNPIPAPILPPAKATPILPPARKSAPAPAKPASNPPSSSADDSEHEDEPAEDEEETPTPKPTSAKATPKTGGAGMGTPKLGSKGRPQTGSKRKSARIARDDDVASNAGLGIPRDMQEIAAKRPRRG